MKEKIKQIHKELLLCAKPSKWWLFGGVVLLLLVISIAFGGTIFSFRNIFILPTPTPTVTPSPTPKKLEIRPAGEGSIKEEDYLTLAKNDLAEKLKIKKEEIKEVGIEKVEWADTSLGCPREDRFYAQVITSGFVITLTAKEKNYLYHAGLNRVTTCDETN